MLGSYDMLDLTDTMQTDISDRRRLGLIFFFHFELSARRFAQ